MKTTTHATAQRRQTRDEIKTHHRTIREIERAYEATRRAEIQHIKAAHKRLERAGQKATAAREKLAKRIALLETRL